MEQALHISAIFISRLLKLATTNTKLEQHLKTQVAKTLSWRETKDFLEKAGSEYEDDVVLRAFSKLCKHGTG